MKFFLQSYVDLHEKKELEEIFFFNTNQSRHRDRIVQAVEEYSAPNINVVGNRAYISLEKGSKGQPLHIYQATSCGPVLVGALIYVRSTVDTITVVHIAIKDSVSSDYESIGEIYSCMRSVFRRINGVKRVKFSYGKSA